jgi:cation transport regulator ChaC
VTDAHEPWPVHEDGDLWIFGYGSLIWRPAFPAKTHRPMVLSGFARRFWQGSPDHRGVPEAPGRVVTLVEDPDAHCVGMAYLVARNDVDGVLARLDHREQAGYIRRTVRLRGWPDGPDVDAVTYYASHENPHFLGPAPVQELAAHVRRAVGPSGTNLAYAQRLIASLDALDALDDHLVALRQHLPAPG